MKRGRKKLLNGFESRENLVQWRAAIKVIDAFNSRVLKHHYNPECIVRHQNEATHILGVTILLISSSMSFSRCKKS